MLVTPRYEGPPIISISGTPNSQLAPVVRQRRRLESLLQGLDEDDWRKASRCEGWTVQDVVSHLVGVNAFWAASVRAGLAGQPTRVLVGFDPKQTPALMVAGMRELAPDDVLKQFVSSDDSLLELLAGLDDDGWEVLAEAPPGHLPIRLIAQHALWDSWVHERDVALPCGIAPTIEPDEVCSSLQYVCALSAALGIGSALATGEFAVDATDPICRLGVTVGDTVVVRDDDGGGGPCLSGESVALVEALSFRVPLPASVPDEWVSLVSGLATAFDVEIVRGP